MHGTGHSNLEWQVVGLAHHPINRRRIYTGGRSPKIRRGIRMAGYAAYLKFLHEMGVGDYLRRGWHGRRAGSPVGSSGSATIREATQRSRCSSGSTADLQIIPTIHDTSQCLSNSAHIRLIRVCISSFRPCPIGTDSRPVAVFEVFHWMC